MPARPAALLVEEHRLPLVMYAFTPRLVHGYSALGGVALETPDPRRGGRALVMANVLTRFLQPSWAQVSPRSSQHGSRAEGAPVG